MNQPSRRQTRPQTPCVGPYGAVALLVGGADSLPMERKGKAGGGSYEAAAAHFVVCVVCVVGRFTIVGEE